MHTVQGGVCIFVLLFIVACVPPQEATSSKELLREGSSKMVNGSSVQCASLTECQQNTSKSGLSVLSRQWSGGRCQGNGVRPLVASPISLDDLKYVVPLGLVVDAHVTPSDHQYWAPRETNFRADAKLNTDRYALYAPADGFIVGVQHMTGYVGDREGVPSANDYRIHLEHSCTFYTYFIHVAKLVPEIVAQLPNGRGTLQTRILVKAGQKIGSIGERSVDFAVVNTEHVLPGFIVPEHYAREPWKIHTVDPFDYFVEPLRSELLKRSLRTTPPYGGKIDFDKDGFLVGNWFKKGTKGYQGLSQERYWDGHVSFVYDHIDPLRVRLSLGDFNGRARQFGVRGNAPDPATVSVSGGPVAYELVQYDYVTPSGQPWSRQDLVQGLRGVLMDRVEGTILVQLMSNRALRLEVFPGKSAQEVNGFTPAAQEYER